jgi:hypothetical protein
MIRLKIIMFVSVTGQTLVSFTLFSKHKIWSLAIMRRVHQKNTTVNLLIVKINTKLMPKYYPFTASCITTALSRRVRSVN